MPLLVPSQPRENISMDFIGGFSTRIAPTNYGVMFQHMFVNITWGRLNIKMFTLWHQQFVSTLTICILCCKVVFYLDIVPKF